jgi:hypothetical protein
VGRSEFISLCVIVVVGVGTSDNKVVGDGVDVLLLRKSDDGNIVVTRVVVVFSTKDLR